MHIYIHREIKWFLFNQPKSDCISHFPTYLAATGIHFGAKLSEKCKYNPNFGWFNRNKNPFLCVCVHWGKFCNTSWTSERGIGILVNWRNPGGISARIARATLIRIPVAVLCIARIAMPRLNVSFLLHNFWHTEKTMFPFPFTLNGIWSCWRFSFK